MRIAVRRGLTFPEGCMRALSLALRWPSPS